MKSIIFFLVFLFLSVQLEAQLAKLGGGLTFSTGVDFNTIETGNPGVFGKAYFEIFENGYLLPSAAVYNRYHRSTVIQSFTNYMFQGDLDFQYQFFRDGPIRLFALAGGHVTSIVSKYEVSIGEPLYSDEKGIQPGVNLGAGVEMYVDETWDSVLSVKYILGPWDQFIIQLGVYYNLYDRKRIGW
jgi:hypothetical protein